MKVTLSRRVEAELEDKFEYGAERFGDSVAERTFSRVRHMIFQTIPAQPEAATYHQDRDLFERVIPRTPFVVYYRPQPASRRGHGARTLWKVRESRFVRGLTIPLISRRDTISTAPSVRARHARSGGPP
jgi:plasmid stabilization system protein ParE